MKNQKRLVLTGVTLLSAAVLAACGGGATKSSAGDSAGSTYSYVYTSDPETLDYLVANKASTGEIVANLVDGLLENDKYGNLVPSLAEDWSVSADGLTYTYTLREDAKWFTADGDEYGAITAEDFVTGLKHAADKKSEALYLVEHSIAGLKDYLDGKETDFAKVGVKAIDERTVQYTLTKAEPFWNSKTTMGILFPVNAEFLASQGEDYGTPKPDSILYSGPYLLSAMTAKSSIEFTKNPEYWDADKVKIDTVKWTYYDGSDPESLAKNFLDGNYDNARIYPNTASYSKIKEEHGDNITYSAQGAGTYFLMPNLGRTNYTNSAKKDDSQKSDTQKALLNKDFRQALGFAIDRAAFVAQSNGKDAATRAIRNLHVPTNFVSAGDENFAQLTAEQLTGDEWAKVDLSDAQDGLFDADKAKAEFDKAKKALEAEGVKFPIRLDMLVDQADEVSGQQYSSLKESIESTLGTDNVIVDLNKVASEDYENATYYATSVDQADFDISVGGWSPDFTDPSTYLDIFTSVGSPYHVRFGVTDGESDDIIKALNWTEYDELIKAATAETDPAARYTKYAAAQAWLLDSGLSTPILSNGGVPRFSRTVPFTAGYGEVGLKGIYSYKGLEKSEKPITSADYDAAKAKWDTEKAKSNADYQESLKERVN